MSKVISILPVYRISDRKKSLEFFCQILGMKVLLEEGAMVYLAGHKENQTGLILEESLTSDGFSEAGAIKKQDHVKIFAEASEIEQLLFNHFDKVKAFRTSENAFGFEAISPDRDVFWVLPVGHSVDELAIKEDLSVKENKEIKLSSFSIEQISLNFSEKGDLHKSLEILKTQDLAWSNFSISYSENEAVKTNKTFDLQALNFLCSQEVDFSALRDALEEFNPYLDINQRVLMVELSEGIELWFEK